MPKINNQVLRNTITTMQREIDQLSVEVVEANDRAAHFAAEVERLEQALATDGTVAYADHQDTLFREVREYDRANKAEAYNKALREVASKAPDDAEASEVCVDGEYVICVDPRLIDLLSKALKETAMTEPIEQTNDQTEKGEG